MFSPNKDKTVVKKVGKTTKNFTPLNTHYEQTWHKVLHMHNLYTLLASKAGVMGSGPGRWCKFHMVKGHQTEDCHYLKKEIERLIQEGHLKKYVKSASSRSLDKSSSH